MKLSTVVYQFFSTYLPHIKGVSSATIKTYRDAFTLFLPFAANYYNIRLFRHSSGYPQHVVYTVF